MFKPGDKVKCFTNAFGIPLSYEKVYIVQEYLPTKDLLFIKNSDVYAQNLFYGCRFRLIPKPPYNHPLTSIFR